MYLKWPLCFHYCIWYLSVSEEVNHLLITYPLNNKVNYSLRKYIFAFELVTFDITFALYLLGLHWCSRWRCSHSPMQEGPVGLGHHPLLSLANEVLLLFVGDGPALLDLTQLLQAIIETLERGLLCYLVIIAIVFKKLLLVVMLMIVAIWQQWVC